MPSQGNSYDLRSYILYKLQPKTPIVADQVKLLIDDIVSTIEGYKTSVGGVLQTDIKGQLITHDGLTPTLLDVGTDGRILMADSASPDGIKWEDPSTLGNDLTKTDDANVTLTLNGTPAGSLLKAVELVLGWAGQLSAARGGTGLSAIGSSLQFLRVNSAGSALEYATLSRMFSQCFYGDTGANLTLTNQSNAENFLAAVSRAVTLLDLTTYTQVRLVTRVQTGSASANSPRLRLRYRTSFSTTVTDYSDIGTSEVSTSLTSTGVIASSWIDITALAKADVYVTVTQIGGDGAADPVIGFVNAQFK